MFPALSWPYLYSIFTCDKFTFRYFGPLFTLFFVGINTGPELNVEETVFRTLEIFLQEIYVRLPNRK